MSTDSQGTEKTQDESLVGQLRETARGMLHEPNAQDMLLEAAEALEIAQNRLAAERKRADEAERESAEQRLAEIEKAAGMPTLPDCVAHRADVCEGYLAELTYAEACSNTDGQALVDIYEYEKLRTHALHQAAARLDAERELGVMRDVAQQLAAIVFHECPHGEWGNEALKTAMDATVEKLTTVQLMHIPFSLSANPIPATPDQQAAARPIE